MGLDSVELVMEVEDEFEIEISDDEATRIRFVGEFVECVANKCARMPQLRCASSQSFYQVRRTLVNLAGVSRSHVRPSSELAMVIPVEARSRVWAQLAGLGLRLPSLQRPKPLVRVAASLVLLVTAVLAVAGATLSGTVTAGLLAIMGCGAATYLAHRLTRPWATSVPMSCARVADAVHYARRAPLADLSRAEISYKVRLIVAEQLGLPLDVVTEEKHLVDDLHID